MGNAPSQTPGQKPAQPQKDKSIGMPANTETVGGQPSSTDNPRNTSGSVCGSGQANK